MAFILFWNEHVSKMEGQGMARIEESLNEAYAAG